MTNTPSIQLSQKIQDKKIQILKLKQAFLNSEFQNSESAAKNQSEDEYQLYSGVQGA